MAARIAGIIVGHEPEPGSMPCIAKFAHSPANPIDRAVIGKQRCGGIPVTGEGRVAVAGESTGGGMGVLLVEAEAPVSPILAGRRSRPPPYGGML